MQDTPKPEEARQPGGRPRIQPSGVRSAVRFWREEREMTQTALAEEAGIRQDVLSRYENGIAVPTIGEVESLAKALDVTVADLYSDELLRSMRGAAEIGR